MLRVAGRGLVLLRSTLTNATFFLSMAILVERLRFDSPKELDSSPLQLEVSLYSLAGNIVGSNYLSLVNTC